MKPEDVNPNNFKVENILYNNGDFSIAYGKWDDSRFSIAMRWNGDGNDPGYPKLFKKPVWFLIDDDLKMPFLKSLLELDSSENELIIETLKKELNITSP